ncbi:hypothetical protein Fcan01_13797 [Folsomia candida]|uniref:Uncharacterized protein n=1 Tax=Folsomia candida TaxID=158441 RepID=A0A226E5W3_FOLCA|nr:hypothetical protein Fcan01_13797 [Folsomia candida]
MRRPNLQEDYIPDQYLQYSPEEYNQYPPQNELSGRGRPAPPIWLPPPPPLSSEENSRASSALSLSHRQHEDEFDDDENSNYSDDGDRQQYVPTADDSDPNQQARWGRSNFTRDELIALDIPLQTKNSNSRPPIFASKTVQLTLCQKIVITIIIILPALCFTAAAHFINDIMTDFKLFSASFSVFQGVFWPSFIFLVIDAISGATLRDGGDEPSSRCLGLCWANGRWKLTLWLIFHSILASISVIAQLLSIQRLNISVSLALSFSSTIFVILLAQINRDKRFSLELIAFSILGYLGFVVVGIPAMTSTRRMDSVDLTWAAAITALVIFGTVFTILEGKFSQNYKLNVRSDGFGYCNILRLRLLIFAFSCAWEIIRQGIWNTFPDAFDIFGSVFVFSAFLLAVGYEAWSLRMSEEVKNSSRPFQFFPWLLSTKKSPSSNNTWK